MFAFLQPTHSKTIDVNLVDSSRFNVCVNSAQGIFIFGSLYNFNLFWLRSSNFKW